MEVATKLRFRPEIALIRPQVAGLLLESYPAEKAVASEHIDFAIAEFREMKMHPSFERAMGLKENQEKLIRQLSRLSPGTRAFYKTL